MTRDHTNAVMLPFRGVFAVIVTHALRVRHQYFQQVVGLADAQSISNPSPLTEFPANREINRELRRNHPLAAIRAKFPTQQNREFLRRNREFAQENREFEPTMVP
jgi:hypothetical protein